MGYPSPEPEPRTRRRFGPWRRTRSGLAVPTSRPRWQTGPLVELPVYAIRDTTGVPASSGKLTGDLRGVTESLPFWAAQGAVGVWLPPFYPSGHENGGYDIVDFRNVDPDYGTLEDFDDLVTRAADLDLYVAVDIVPCHTSRHHPHFQSSRHNRSGPYGDHYVWHPAGDIFVSYRDEDGRKHEVVNVLEVDPYPRLVRDLEGDLVAARNWRWDTVRREYYWAPFKPGQPALNYDNRAVRAWMLDNFRFWAERGVRVFRVDAPTHALQRDGTQQWDLVELGSLWEWFNAELTTEFPGVVLLCEADVRDLSPWIRPDRFRMGIDFRARAGLWLTMGRREASPLLRAVGSRPPTPAGTVYIQAISTHDDVRAKTEPVEDQRFLQQFFGDGVRGVPAFGDAVVGGFASLLRHDRAAMELMLWMDAALPGTSLRYYRDVTATGHHLALVRVSGPGADPRPAVRTPAHWNAGRNGGFSDGEGELYLPMPDDPWSCPEVSNVEDAVDPNNSRSWLHYERRVNWWLRLHPAATVGSFDLLKGEHGETWGCLRVEGDEALVFGFNLHPLDPRPLVGGLPDEHRKWLAGAAMTGLGNADLGELRGDRVKFPLGPQGWLVAKLTPSRRKFLAFGR